jgi:hypothetical protein
MDRPMFVETSNGLVNLSLVQTIRKAPSGNIAFWFEGVTDRLEIPEKEWHRIRGGMADSIPPWQVTGNVGMYSSLTDYRVACMAAPPLAGSKKKVELVDRTPQARWAVELEKQA